MRVTRAWEQCCHNWMTSWRTCHRLGSPTEQTGETILCQRRELLAVDFFHSTFVLTCLEGVSMLEQITELAFSVVAKFPTRNQLAAGWRDSKNSTLRQTGKGKITRTQMLYHVCLVNNVADNTVSVFQESSGESWVTLSS